CPSSGASSRSSACCCSAPPWWPSWSGARAACSPIASRPSTSTGPPPRPLRRRDSRPPARMNPPLLEVQHLTMRFGGLVAVNDLSLTARKGEITAIIGPNGAGKTTVFNCLTGFYKPTVGQLTFHRDGETLLLEQIEGFRIARAGVARTFQNI